MKKSVQNSPNIDHNEIAKFEALATRWWDPESEFRTLHQLQPSIGRRWSQMPFNGQIRSECHQI